MTAKRTLENKNNNNNNNDNNNGNVTLIKVFTGTKLNTSRIILSEPHISPVKEMLLLPPFYR